MHLVYLDESGNTGSNLNDPQQPVFALCAMVVEESRWQSLERALQSILDARLPHWRSTDNFEVHAADLRIGRGHFKDMSVADRIAFRNEWMEAGTAHGVRLCCRTVAKKLYAQWLAKKFGQGIMINPHVVAFALLSRCVDTYLASLPRKPMGMFIFDENKEIVADIEKSIRVLRGEVGSVRLTQIIEKGFFIDSTKSLPLQLCDLYALSLRKKTERTRKLTEPKSFDDAGIELAEPLLYDNREHDEDVFDWLTRQQAAQKNSGQGNYPRVD